MGTRSGQRLGKTRRLAEGEYRAIRIADGRGFYLLFEGQGRKRIWRIYDRKSGVTVATYWTDSKRVVMHAGEQSHFQAEDATEVIEGVRQRFTPKEGD